MACIDPDRCWQDRDNYRWLRDAGKNRLVVESQARILYLDAEGRVWVTLPCLVEEGLVERLVDQTV